MKPPRIETLREWAIMDLTRDGLPKVPIVLELAEEVKQIQERRNEDRPWILSAAKPKDRVQLAWRRERYEADSERLKAIGRFLALASQAARRHRLTSNDWFAMLEDQGYECAICRSRLGVDLLPCVDHNHATGEVRGLLCGNCNTGIGHLGDSPQALRRALDYLTERGHYGEDS